MIWAFRGHWMFLTEVWDFILIWIWVPDWGLASWYWFGYGHWSLVLHMPNFGSLSWFWRCKEHPCPLSPDLELWRTLEVPDCGLASWYWFGYGHWPSVHPYAKFWLSILILKLQRSSMSFKAWFGALEDAGGSWLGFGILILIWIRSLVFGTPILLSPKLIPSSH